MFLKKDRKRKFQSLGISVNAKYWNFKDNCLKEDCPNYELLQLIIDTELGKIKRKALENRLEGKVFTDRVSPLRRNLLKGKMTKLANGKYRCAYKTK